MKMAARRSIRFIGATSILGGKENRGQGNVPSQGCNRKCIEEPQTQTKKRVEQTVEYRYLVSTILVYHKTCGTVISVRTHNSIAKTACDAERSRGAAAVLSVPIIF